MSLVYDQEQVRPRPRPRRPDRARLLALWLLENADQVNAIENVQIVFNCAGSKANVEMTNRQKIDSDGLLGLDLSDILRS